jgi:hypothetical protein
VASNYGSDHSVNTELGGYIAMACITFLGLFAFAA